MSAHATLLSPGPLCTIQDLGRRQGRREGLAPGGALDQRAFLWANRLLENAPDAPALEVTLGGLKIAFESETVIALTGADCEATVEGRGAGNWRTVRIQPGQTLRLGYSSSGLRAYVGFSGGLAAPEFFGSASIVIRDGLPSPLDRALESGQPLFWVGGSRSSPPRSVPIQYRAGPADSIELPFISGYEWEQFTVEDHVRFMSTTWVVGEASDRVATRLAGANLESGPKELDSVPLIDGTVQVPGDGAPLVFMRDRPTIGGYPKLGSVDPVALDLLAQARPGTVVQFVATDPAAARARLRRRETFFGFESI